MDEQSWDRGYRAALTGVIQSAMADLGYDLSGCEAARLVIEREQAIAMLRSVCEEHGDNDWPNDLHLADIIDKHLGRHLYG